MSEPVARAIMMLARGCWGERRRDWADAMDAEFPYAVADGRALPYALGCLVAGWRALPGHVEGRLLLVRHAVAFGLILPLAALLLAQAGGVFGPVNDGNRTAAPVLVELAAAIAALRLLVAAALLDQAWGRVAALERLSAAAIVALGVLAALALLDVTPVVPLALTVAAEATVLRALARLHEAAVPTDA